MARLVAGLSLALLGALLSVLAYLRGDYLFGFPVGIFYAVVAGLAVWLLVRLLVFAETPSFVGAVAVVAVSVVVGLVLAFPAAVNSDVQVAIDRQAEDRAARAELAAVFASDPAFSGLWASTTHLKVVNVTIHGSLPARADLNRLRERIANECPAVEYRPLHWDVTIQDQAQRHRGLDDDLFKVKRRR
jgi:hypothetical protein